MIDKTKYCIYNINYSFNPVSVIIYSVKIVVISSSYDMT